MGKETFPDAEGMNQRLCEAVEHMELLARDDTGLLDVYLIEFPSVTVARINGPTRYVAPGRRAI